MIKVEHLDHTYKNKGRDEHAIKNLSLQIKKGENVVVIGSSGSGKSTLLKSINRLIEPLSGDIFIKEENILKSPPKKVCEIRSNIGMIFQNFNLLERETVLSNVLNGRLRYNDNLKTIFKIFSQEDYDVACGNIRRVGLERYEKEKVFNLSGGQKQRVAIARALSQNPEIILADEPVSSLDPKLMKEIMDLLKNICDEKNITLVASLHFLDLARKYGSRIIGLRDGELVFDGTPDNLSEKDIVDIYGKTKDWYLYGKVGF